jgi:hypothetical protein
LGVPILDRDRLAGLFESLVEEEADRAFADAAFFREKGDDHEEGSGS